MKSDSESHVYAVAPHLLDKSSNGGDAEKCPKRVEFDHRYSLRILQLIFLTTVILLGWSWFTELNGIAQASGQLIPDEEVQPIRAAFDSRVKSLLVKAGDRVRKGDLLLTLDAKSIREEFGKYSHELKIAEHELGLHQQSWHILNQYLKDTSRLPSDLSGVPPVVKAISDLFSARQRLTNAQRDFETSSTANERVTAMQALQSQAEMVDDQQQLKKLATSERHKQFKLEEEKTISKISSVKKEIELQKLSAEQKRLSLEGTQKQLEAYQKAFKSGASSQTECLEAKMRVEDCHRDLTNTISQLIQLQGQLESAKHELAQLRSHNAEQLAQMEAASADIAASSGQIKSGMRGQQRALSEAHTSYQVALRAANSTLSNEAAEMAEIQNQVQELKASIKAAEHMFEKSDVRAPVDGAVALVHLQGAEEVIQRGQDLLTIVPNRDKLLAVLHVQNKDVPFLHIGDLVKLQFRAYPYQQYGTISAKVTYMDSFPSQEKEYATTYKVLAEPTRDWIFCRGKKIPLRKGLELDAQIVMPKQRLIMTLVAPLLKARYAHFKA